MGDFDEQMNLEQALRQAVDLREAIAGRTAENREDGSHLKELKEAIGSVMESENMDKIDNVPSAAIDEETNEPEAYYVITRPEKMKYPSRAEIMEEAVQQFLAEGNAFAWKPAMEYVDEYRKRRGELERQVQIRKKKPKKKKDDEENTVAFDELGGGDGDSVVSAKDHGPPRI